MKKKLAIWVSKDNTIWEEELGALANLPEYENDEDLIAKVKEMAWAEISDRPEPTYWSDEALEEADQKKTWRNLPMKIRTY